MDLIVSNNTIMSKQEKTDMSLSDAEDSGISSWDSNTDVDSDIDLKTATLKDEIVVLKAGISKKDEQISTMQECMSRYEQQICNKNHLVQVLKKEIVKYESAHDTLMKLNKILKDNTGILEKSVLKRTKMLSKVKEDFDKLYQLKQNAEKTLRKYNNSSKSEFPKRKSEVKGMYHFEAIDFSMILGQNPKNGVKFFYFIFGFLRSPPIY